MTRTLAGSLSSGGRTRSLDEARGGSPAGKWQRLGRRLRTPAAWCDLPNVAVAGQRFVAALNTGAGPPEHAPQAYMPGSLRRIW